MKLFILLSSILLFSFAKAQGSIECALGIRIYSYKYVGATTTMELILGFKSSCHDFDSYNFFLLPFNVNFGLNSKKHPKDVILQLFGKVYKLSFISPKPDGKGKYYNIFYQHVTVQPSQSRKPIYTMAPNNILLQTDEVNLFSKENMDALIYKNNPCICELSPSKNTMFCKIT